LIKVWNNSPIAFRNAFLATLGVISALIITYYCFDWFYIIPRKETLKSSLNTSSSLPVIDPNYQWKVAGRSAFGWVIAWKFKVRTLSPYVIAGQVDFLDKDGFVLATDYFSPIEIKGNAEISQSCLISSSIARQIAGMRLLLKK